MQNSQNKKSLQIVLVVLIAVLTLGIGYASITAINLIISGNATASASQENFKVKFIEEENVTPVITSNDGGTGNIDVTNDTTATFNISGLDATGESATANYVVKNISEGIGAKITINLTSTNTEYFKVTTTVVDDTLQAGEETDVRVKVEMLKTPVDNPVTTTVTATLTATPMENAEASGGETVEEVRPVDPYIYIIGGDISGMYTNILNGLDPAIRTYSNFAAAKADYGHPAAIALKIESGSITESYIAFEKDGNIYNLKRPVVDENSLNDRPIYDENVALLKEIFGPDWQSVCSENSNSFSCFVVDSNFHYVVNPGAIFVWSNGWGCTAFADGKVGCINS